MEIIPTIFCTLDNESELVIKEVFEILPSEIREFHQHINIANNGKDVNEPFTEAIKYVQTDRKNSKHSARHISTGALQFNFFVLFRKNDKNKITDASNSFKDKFKEIVQIGDFSEILFNLSEDDTSELKKDFYQICNLDSHGTRIENEILFEKIKYFFLFYLTSDLYGSEKIENTNYTFYFGPNIHQKNFKSIALDVDGLPIFSLREYYFEALKEKYIRELLQEKNELDDEAALNKLQTVSSLQVEKFKSPTKPENPLKLSFWSTKKGRKQIIEDAMKAAFNRFNDYERSCHSNAKKQRIDLEEEVKSKKPNELKIIINEIINSSNSITDLIKLIRKLLDKNGKIYNFLKNKENEIKWPKMFDFSKKDFVSNHPNWLIFSILGALLFLPELIDYLLYFPTEYMIKWNVWMGLIWGGYTLYSVFNIRSVRSSFNEFYMKNLQGIESYFSNAFTAFIKYLELHIIKLFLRRINTINDELIKNQTFLLAYYLTSFKNGNNYSNIKNIYSNHLKRDKGYSDLFVEKLAQNLLQLIKENEELSNKLDEISRGKDYYNLSRELIELVENDKDKTQLERLEEKIRSNKYGEIVISIVKEIVNRSNLSFNMILFVEKMSLKQLDEQINEFIRNQNFDNLLSEIKEKIGFSVEESVNKLLNQDHKMYYLTPSQNKDDEKKMIFIPEFLNRKEVVEYFIEHKVICGYLKVGNFNLKNSVEERI